LIKSGTKLSSRYRVDGYIDSGGMQDVYKAFDELTQTFVALKTPQAGQANIRFRDSAKLSARINHYNVAKTYDYFESGGSSYMIEELVEGSTLEKATLALVPQIDPHLAAYLFLKISKGLFASHTAGVAHRDLKPSNILVRSPRIDDVKITDFGIATIAEKLFEETVFKGDLTRSTSGTIKGALPYMAPEMMFRQKGDYVGSEADIWSVGAMMFHLLAGEYPFGEGMMVPVNVKGMNRAPWPRFLTSNPQFAPLCESIKSIAEMCLDYDKTKRIVASDLVQQCENLCFNCSSRSHGVVESKWYSHGRIRTNGGTLVFFHSDSVYGRYTAQVGSEVQFSTYPGEPYPRAHPVIVAKQ
jgi:serine/threonine protein kinase, bacterial